MNISLAPELEQIVTRRVQSGQYHSPSEVIEKGLRLLEEQEASPEARLAELRREIAVGVAQADGGMVKPFDAEELKQRVRRQVAEA